MCKTGGKTCFVFHYGRAEIFLITPVTVQQRETLAPPWGASTLLQLFARYRRPQRTTQNHNKKGIQIRPQRRPANEPE